LVARVVRQRVVAFRDADRGKGPVAARIGEHERGHARRVRLEGGGEDRAHHLDVLAVVAGRARGELDVRRRVGRHLLGALDLLLDGADALEVLVELALVARPEPRAQALGVLVDHVEDGAGIGRLAGDLGLGGAGLGVAEEPDEQVARAGLLRVRLVRRAPGDVRRVRAAVARVAVARLRAAVGAELERREARVTADLLGDDLVGGDADVDVLAIRLLRVHAGEVHRAVAGVVAGAVAQAFGVLLLEAGDVADRAGQRLEGRE